MEARRDLFPDVGAQFADVDAFLVRVLVDVPEPRRRSSTRRSGLPIADGRRIDVLRRMRDVAVDLSRATTRRSVAMVMLQAAMEVADGKVGTIAFFRGRGRGGAIVGPICWRPCRRVMLGGFVPSAPQRTPSTGLLEAHASLDLPSLEEVRRAIGDEPSDVLGAASLAAYPIVWRDRVRGALIIAAPGRRVHSTGSTESSSTPS